MADHPTSAELLMAREEPSQPESRRILDHAATCAACTRMMATLDATEQEIAAYCQTTAARLAPPPPVDDLRLRMRAEMERRPIAFPIRRKLMVAAALAASLAIAFFVRNPLQPESVEAAELLRHASEYVRTANPSSRARAAEVRSGGRVIRMSEATHPQLVKSLELAYVNWHDPLSPSDFARWRDAQAGKSDLVTRDSAWIRLTTTVLGDGPVRSASITVNQADWRPIARTVEFHDREAIEVREVASAAPAPPESLSKAGQPAEESVAAPVTARQAEDLEVKLWEALRRVDADILDGGDVAQDASGICYQVWPDEGRREQVNRALASVTGARACTATTASARKARVLSPLSAEGGIRAPFADALAKQFGGREGATSYVDAVLRQHIELLARVTALERLLRRFTPERFEDLPQDHQRRIRAIAAEHVGAIQTRGKSYLDLVAQGLHAAAPSAQRPDPARRGSTLCQTTAPMATSLATDLKALQDGFNRLFGGADLEAVDTVPDALLRNTERHHASLSGRLAALCVVNE